MINTKALNRAIKEGGKSPSGIHILCSDGQMWIDAEEYQLRANMEDVDRDTKSLIYRLTGDLPYNGMNVWLIKKMVQETIDETVRHWGEVLESAVDTHLMTSDGRKILNDGKRLLLADAEVMEMIDNVIAVGAGYDFVRLVCQEADLIVSADVARKTELAMILGLNAGGDIDGEDT